MVIHINYDPNIFIPKTSTFDRKTFVAYFQDPDVGFGSALKDVPPKNRVLLMLCAAELCLNVDQELQVGDNLGEHCECFWKVAQDLRHLGKLLGIGAPAEPPSSRGSCG